MAVLLSYAPRFMHETGLGAWLAGGGRSSGGVRRQRLQRGLVVAQIAVSVVLLTGAGLLVRTMLRLSEVDTGLNAPEVLTMEVAVDYTGKNVDRARAAVRADARASSRRCPASPTSASDR